MTAQHHQQEQQQQQQHYHPTYDCKVLKNNRHVVLIHLSITIYMKNSKNYVEANRQTDGRTNQQMQQAAMVAAFNRRTELSANRPIGRRTGS